MLKLKFLWVIYLFTGCISFCHAQWLTTGTTTYYNPVSNNIAIGTNTASTTKLLVIGNARFANTIAAGAGYADLITGAAINTSLELGSTTTASQVDFKGSTNLLADFRGRLKYTDGTGFAFQTAGSTTDKVVITDAGAIGVGIVPIPGYSLHVSGVNNKFEFNSSNFVILSTLGGQVGMVGSGSGLSPRITFSDDYDVSTATDAEILYTDAEGMTFSTAGFNKRMKIQPDGKVVIGDLSLISTTGMTYNYKLFVQDGIITERLKVAMRGTAQWADYVFEPGYELLSLDSVEAYTKAYKHLPGMPSADEVEKEGIDVANMDALLLKQIEELWLQVMILKKENEELRKMVQD